MVTASVFLRFWAFVTVNCHRVQMLITRLDQEIIWGFVFGSVLSLIMLYFFDIVELCFFLFGVFATVILLALFDHPPNSKPST